MSTTGNNRLAVLAAEVKEADGRCRRSAEAAAAAAIEAGHKLIEAKELLQHGEWLPWLREHAAISGRTARRYMQLARSGLEVATVADLGIRGSAQRLARSRVLRPPVGHYAVAVADAATKAIIWRDLEQADRFHVLVFGRIDGRDHMCSATDRPAPDEWLSQTVADAGFPLGNAPFAVRSFPDDAAFRVLETLRTGVFFGAGGRR